MAKRPRRQNRGDRLLDQSGSSVLTKVDFAVAPFDRAMRDADRRWGVDRLPELVSPATSAKWGETVSNLNDAIRAEDAEAVVQWVGVCLRGLPHLEAEAERAGHDKLPPAVFEWNEGGQHFLVTPDANMWPILERTFPGVPVFSMREVAMALKQYGETVVRVKEHFPGAQVTAVNPPVDFEKELGDAIAF